MPILVLRLGLPVSPAPLPQHQGIYLGGHLKRIKQPNSHKPEGPYIKCLNVKPSPYTWTPDHLQMPPPLSLIAGRKSRVGGIGVGSPTSTSTGLFLLQTSSPYPPCFNVPITPAAPGCPWSKGTYLHTLRSEFPTDRTFGATHSHP